jgi:L-malate glycosyltransferase
MKVLHYLDTVGRGGAEMQVLDLCRNAADAGIDMIVAAGGGGALDDEFQTSGVEFIRLQRKFPVDLYLASQLRRIIKERRIDIVHGYQAVDGVHLYLASRGLKNVKRVLSFQGFIPDKRNRLASRFLIPRMDLNIVVSRGLQEWLRENDGLDTSGFELLYNGADPARVVPRGGGDIRRELAVPHGAPLLGMIGNFYRDPRKDQLTVCRALPHVFDLFPEAHCLFAGRIEEGAEHKMADCLSFCIENKLTDRVHFLGSRGDVPNILARLDVFIFSSLQEGLPVAVSEAMLAGVPMIVSDIQPLLEASGDGRYAEVFPVQDEAALAEKITGLLLDPERRKQMAAEARAFAEKNFSIGAHTARLKALYDAILPTAAGTQASRAQG